MTTTTTVPAGALMTVQQTGEYLGLKVQQLAQMRYLGTGPQFVKLNGRAVRYRQSDLDAWIETRLRDRTDQKSGAGR